MKLNKYKGHIYVTITFWKYDMGKATILNILIQESELFINKVNLIWRLFTVNAYNIFI